MKTTPWPTNTSSSITTPEQMKLWLEILHRRPIRASRCTSTKAPSRVSSPISHPYRFTNGLSRTRSPRRTSGATHTLNWSRRSGIDFFFRPQRDWTPIAPQRLVGGFKHAHHAQPAEPGGERRGSVENAAHEMLAFDLQGLRLLDSRNMDVAVAVRKLELAESVVVGMQGDALVVDADFFLGGLVVVNQHLA